MMPEGKGWLMAEFGADNKEEALETAHRVMEMLKSEPGAPSMKLFTEKEDMAHLWEMRESGLGATAFVPGERDHVAGMGRFGGGAGEARADICAIFARCIRSTNTIPHSTATLARAVFIAAWISISPASRESGSGARSWKRRRTCA